MLKEAMVMSRMETLHLMHRCAARRLRHLCVRSRPLTPTDACAAVRSDTTSAHLFSSPSPEFLNRYATSAFAEDKAEVLTP